MNLPEHLNLEFYEEDRQNYLIISEENSTGYTYAVNNIDDILQHIKNYIGE